jgi:hypothetical protein
MQDFCCITCLECSSYYTTLNFMNVKSDLRQNGSGATTQQCGKKIALLRQHSKKTQNAFTTVDLFHVDKLTGRQR